MVNLYGMVNIMDNAFEKAKKEFEENEYFVFYKFIEFIAFCFAIGVIYLLFKCE